MKKKLEQIENSCGDFSLDGDTDMVRDIAEPINKAEKHPTPEQLLIREATKYLTPKQRKVWELHNYDRLTQEEIAFKLKLKSHSVVSRHIKAAEKRIVKWCKSNMGAYRLLKQDYDDR